MVDRGRARADVGEPDLVDPRRPGSPYVVNKRLRWLSAAMAPALFWVDGVRAHSWAVDCSMCVDAHAPVANSRKAAGS